MGSGHGFWRWQRGQTRGAGTQQLWAVPGRLHRADAVGARQQTKQLTARRGQGVRGWRPAARWAGCPTRLAAPPLLADAEYKTAREWPGGPASLEWTVGITFEGDDQSPAAGCGHPRRLPVLTPLPPCGYNSSDTVLTRLRGSAHCSRRGGRVAGVAARCASQLACLPSNTHAHKSRHHRGRLAQGVPCRVPPCW